MNRAGGCVILPDAWEADKRGACRLRPHGGLVTVIEQQLPLALLNGAAERFLGRAAADHSLAEIDKPERVPCARGGEDGWVVDSLASERAAWASGSNTGCDPTRWNQYFALA